MRPPISLRKVNLSGIVMSNWRPASLSAGVAGVDNVHIQIHHNIYPLLYRVSIYIISIIVNMIAYA